MQIRLYCGIGEKKWNHHPVNPGPYACVAPVYGSNEKSRKENRVFMPEGVEVIQDSGAFSDGPAFRLTKEEALKRQLYHSNKYNYSDKVSHIASYDLLIDERWENGQRFKSRWDVVSAEKAVEETWMNAVWLSNHRPKLSLILTAQGVSPDQYLYCSQRIIPFLKENDMFGFGGFCITGKMRRKMMPTFAETVQKVMPEIYKAGIKRVHLWGVMLDEALAQISYWCEKFQIQLSTDSVGPSVYPARGNWGYSDWRDNSYKQPPTSIRGLERAKHVEATRLWLNTFDYTKYLHPLYKDYLL